MFVSAAAAYQALGIQKVHLSLGASCVKLSIRKALFDNFIGWLKHKVNFFKPVLFVIYHEFSSLNFARKK